MVAGRQAETDLRAFGGGVAGGDAEVVVHLDGDLAPGRQGHADLPREQVLPTTGGPAREPGRGVESVEDRDDSPEEKLMHETGLGLSKVRKIKQGAKNFLDSEQTVIEDARRALAESAPEEAPAETGAEG